MGIFSKIFPSYNDKELKKITKIVDKIEALSDKFKSMSDKELTECTQLYKERVASGESLDSLLPEAFATVREASERVLGMRHFNVQLVGGVVLHQGRIAEMRTGEGKTLVATLPAYLNALSGKGMHIVTVNDYLAKRDAEWMGKIFKFLGLTVGVNHNGMNYDEKKIAYGCDILYTTNNELGFDYLRDNMVKSVDKMVQRDLAFAIIDEVDSILIDEARTPLIISGQGEKSSENYVLANRFAKTLTEEDYELSEKDKTIFLNENGSEKAEKYFKIENLSDYENQDLKHYIDNALKATYIMNKEDDYLVVDGEIIIVDEFTGRQMIGRRYSNGLHQAIEAKENLQVRSENKTLATITFQNFFRLYRKLSGMTGTAKTEENEFEAIYKLDVIVVPTNRDVARIDHNDQLFVSPDAKYKAIIKDIQECYARKQPVLVGTVSVERSEFLSKLLTKAKVAHKVLNAKNHQLEAEIVAQAGKAGAVTIATNMAGRGTDILLGGNPEYMAKQKMLSLGYSTDAIECAISHLVFDDENIKKAKVDYAKYFQLFEQDCAKEKEEVIASGGLKIIGTERHESRRIDNQLRGRSGRQGDPGSSIFYLSMDDDIMRNFGGEHMKNIVTKLNLPEDQPISAKIITNQIQSAQARVEDRNFSIRKHVLGYDDVMNKQREIIYNQRRLVIGGMKVHDQIMAMLKAVIERMVKKFADIKIDHRDWDYEGFNNMLEATMVAESTNFMTPELVEECGTAENLCERIYDYASKQYEDKVTYVKEEIGIDFDVFERDCMLYNVDSKWMEHIDNMSQLKQGISLVAYAQRDPVQVYKQEGYEMFDTMVNEIQNDTIKILLKSRFEKATETASKEQKNLQTNKTNSSGTYTAEKKANRNDPCPCGSGKKYKNCCAKND